jgi:hypothetical protein
VRAKNSRRATVTPKPSAIADKKHRVFIVCLLSFSFLH